ncbi:hypothetical protein H9Q74_002508 [Fusarium xylarioides]|nr:hypothetical protein H9Q71_006949 [Fusarium xylarioides]KAG5827382.1 hypothetical protein H9Q74_002508 [Fusarium xylarioides]
MPTILVVGATGQQGGGVVKALLSSGRTDLVVRALTRNPTSGPAYSLAYRGVQLVKGDLLDPESLARALGGADAAYLVTDFRGYRDTDGELEQGRQFIDAAKTAGLKHVVFSSVAGADIAQAVDHFNTKYKLEEYLRESGLAWTIVRPVGFMEVIPPPGISRSFFLGAMAALLGNTKQKYIACEDIGKIVATALLSPTIFRERTLTIVGQVANVTELRAALENGEGQRGWPQIWPPRWLVIRLTPPHYKQMFDWLYYGNCQPGEVEETRTLIPDLIDIKLWAARQKAARDLQ